MRQRWVILDAFQFIGNRADEHSCVREEIFEGGISEFICVLMEVDLSLRLMVMLCRFCKTFPNRSKSVFAVSPTTLDAGKIFAKTLHVCEDLVNTFAPAT